GGGQRGARSRYAVIRPRRLEQGLERRARRLLVEQGYAVGVTDHARELAVVCLLLALGERDGRRLRGRCRLLRPLAEGQPRLDDERVAAIHRRRPRHRRVEVALDLLVEAVEDRLL